MLAFLVAPQLSYADWGVGVNFGPSGDHRDDHRGDRRDDRHFIVGMIILITACG